MNELKFGALEGENFLTLEKINIDLKDRGLVLIQGRNEEDSSTSSNGAGKSSIPDLLCWVLYGVTARGLSGDAVVNNRAGKNCWGAITFTIADDTWNIVRYRKHKEGKNSVKLLQTDASNKIIDHTKGTDKLTQESINQVIGSTYDIFRAANYAAQKQLPDLPSLTDKMLKMLVEEAAGVNVLQAAYEKARAEGAKIKSETAEQENKASRITAQIEMVRDTDIPDLKTRRKDFEESRVKDIKTAVFEAKNKADSSKTFTGGLSSIDREPLVKKIAECEKQIDAVADEQKEKDRLTKIVSDAKSAWSVTKQQLQLAKNIVSGAIEDLEDIQHKVGCPCPECNRPLEAKDIEAVEKTQKERVRVSKESQKDAEKKFEDCTEALNRAQEALESHESSMTDIKGIQAQRAELSDTLAEIDEVHETRKKLLSEAKNAAKRAKELKEAANPFDAQIKAKEDQFAKLKAGLTAIEKNLDDKRKSARVAEEVMKIFSPAGVRAHILDTVTPYLNDRTQKYLSVLSDGNIHAQWTTLVRNSKGEWREKFSIEVANDVGGHQYAALSGGEQHKVRIATSLALQDLVATRAARPIDIFIGDEIDDSVDQPGLERLMMILEEKAKTCGTVFIISHNDLKDWISNIVTVTKSAGSKGSVLV